MTDPIKAFESINLKSEAFWDKYLKIKQKAPENIFNSDGKGGGHIGTNPVKELEDYGNPVEENMFWQSPKTIWLVKGQYLAYQITIYSEDDIAFDGIWKDGQFKGSSFGELGTSKFLGGYFSGKEYKGKNETFQTSPAHFMSGSYLDHENGILGKTDIKSGTYTSVELITVPVNSFLIIEDEDGNEIGFKLLKRLDEDSTEFQFHVIPSSKTVKIPWETIRSDYQNVGFINVGAPYILPGVINVKEVKSIQILSDYKFVPELSDTINFTIDKRLGIPSKVKFKFDSKEEHDSFVVFKNDIENGRLYNVLKDINDKIKYREITGFGKYNRLSDIFNGIQGTGSSTDEGNKVLAYLSGFKKFVMEKALPLGPNYAALLKLIQKVAGVDKLVAAAPSPGTTSTTPPASSKAAFKAKAKGIVKEEILVRSEIRRILEGRK